MAVAHEASSAARLEPAVRAAAERLFNQHRGWIYGYCLRQLRSPEEAEDALQAVYLNACRSLNQGFEPKTDGAWLFKVAQNVCVTKLRSSGRRARLERAQDTDVLEETVAAPERHADELMGLSDALAALPEQQRQAILLREWQGLSYREVAARLGLSQAAVETLIFRARRSLADELVGRRKRRRARAFHALDLIGVLAGAKTLLVGGAATAAVVAATVAVVASGPAQDEAPAPKPRTVDSVPPAAVTSIDPESARAAERPFFAPPPVVAGSGERGRVRGHGKKNVKGNVKGNADKPEHPAKSEAPGQGGSSRPPHADRPDDPGTPPSFAGSKEPPPHASSGQRADKKP